MGAAVSQRDKFELERQLANYVIYQSIAIYYIRLGLIAFGVMKSAVNSYSVISHRNQSILTMTQLHELTRCLVAAAGAVPLGNEGMVSQQTHSAEARNGSKQRNRLLHKVPILALGSPIASWVIS